MKAFFLNHRAWLWPLIAMALITPFTPALDLAISHHYYDPQQAFISSPFDTFLYNYSIIPAQLLFVGAAIVLFLSCLFKKWKKWYPHALILVLTLAIGAGLIVHVVFKDHWGRPRPKQIIEFGGTQSYRPYYEPNFFHQPEPSKSFSCGHCTMGFYFFSLALVGRRLKNRKLFWGSLATAFILGIAISIGRIAQGGHFFSDTLVTALVMWLTAYACQYWVYLEEDKL